jgi:anaerobic magnesium-protoporphyrin IX monomethyl ester cyclase
MTDILLVNPPSPKGLILESLGLGYLASCLRRGGFDAEILDAPLLGFDYTRLTEEIRARDCRILAVSVIFQENLRSVLEWLADLRAAGFNAHITLGGHPATFTFKEILTEYKAVDSVVRGEGEFTLLELAQKIRGDADWRDIRGVAYRADGEVVLNEPRPLIADLNSLPWPARDVMAARPSAFEHLAVVASRGCHGRCSFCSIAAFYRGFKGPVWRGRDPGDVLDEIDAARKIYPHPFVILFDDCFIGPGKAGRRRAYRFGEALVARRVDYSLCTSCRADQVDEDLFGLLKAGGLKKVFLGVESGNEATLELYDKRSGVETNRRAIETLNKLGLDVDVGFIMFSPYTTFDRLQQDLDFLMASGCGPDATSCGSLGLFPGQPIVSRLEADDLLTGDAFNYGWVFEDPAVGRLFETVRTGLLDVRSFAALRQAHMIDQAAALGMADCPAAATVQARAVVADFRQAVYRCLVEAALLFETGRGTAAGVDRLKRRFRQNCASLDKKAAGLMALSGTGR